MSFKLLKEMMDGEFSFDTSMGQGGDNQEPNPAANIFSKQTQDHPDVIAMDVPTLIRIMEWAHEDCKDDVMLHQFANALILTSFRHSPLDIDDYQEVVDSLTTEPNGGGSGTTEPSQPTMSREPVAIFNN
jgi:hypothetical protein